MKQPATPTTARGRGRLRGLLGTLAGVAALSMVVGTAPGASAMWTSAHHSGMGITSTGPSAAVMADPVASFLDGHRVSSVSTWRVAPGVRYREWTQRDSRGQIHAHLLTVDPAIPGVGFDYAFPGSVRGCETARRLIARLGGAVAGVNGDFYDIHDTGAPLGLGVDRLHGLLHALRISWNSAFLVKDGLPSVARVPMRARIAEEPGLVIEHYNSPTIFDGQVGIYDHLWGILAGTRVVDRQTSHVRQVVIRANEVVANSTTLTTEERVHGLVLVGRGAGADALRALEVGEPAHLTWGLRGDPDVAISGNHLLLVDGVRRAVDDLEMHPRTAIGIDHDTGQVLLLVVDGRQASSRGYTMVELARLMRALGAEDALNLDGGGSSTMLGRRPGSSTVEVLNSPSDGFERQVSNALAVTYGP